jgi:hypothetical protein
MDDEGNMTKRDCLIFWLSVAACAILMLLSSCKTVERTVEHAQSDTIIVFKNQRDSIYIDRLTHDSVFVRVQGDTLTIERWHTEYVDRWRDRLLVDTVYVSKADRLDVSQTVTTQPVMNIWQKIRIGIGNVAIILIISWLSVFFLKKVSKI